MPFSLRASVLPFLCNKERESVSMSALPKAQTSRFEREIRRERDDDDDDVVSSLLCFCFERKNARSKKALSSKRGKEDAKRKDLGLNFLTDILLCVRACIKESGVRARWMYAGDFKRKAKPRPCLGFIFALFWYPKQNAQKRPKKKKVFAFRSYERDSS